MSAVSFASVKVGDKLPEHICGPITRTTLGLFAGASGDHNPIHIDLDFARKFGMKDVFAHGMLSMAFLAQLLTKWVPQQQLRNWNVRFVSITPVQGTVVCSGQVTDKFEADGEKRVKLAISAKLKDGPETLVGEATVALP